MLAQRPLVKRRVFVHQGTPQPALVLWDVFLRDHEFSLGAASKNQKSFLYRWNVDRGLIHFAVKTHS